MAEDPKSLFDSRWEEIFPENQIIEELAGDPTEASFVSAESTSFKDDKRDGKSLVNMLRNFNRQLKQNPTAFLKRQVTAPNIEDVLKSLNEDMDPELLKLLNEPAGKGGLAVPGSAGGHAKPSETKENSRLNDSFSSQARDMPKGASSTRSKNALSRGSIQKVENSPALSSRSNAKEKIDQNKAKMEEEKNKRAATINNLQSEFDAFFKQQEERKQKLKQLETEKVQMDESKVEKPYQQSTQQESGISIEQVSFNDQMIDHKETTAPFEPKAPEKAKNSANDILPKAETTSKGESLGLIQLKIPALPTSKAELPKHGVKPVSHTVLDQTPILEKAVFPSVPGAPLQKIPEESSLHLKLPPKEPKTIEPKPSPTQQNPELQEAPNPAPKFQQTPTTPAPIQTSPSPDSPPQKPTEEPKPVTKPVETHTPQPPTKPVQNKATVSVQPQPTGVVAPAPSRPSAPTAPRVPSSQQQPVQKVQNLTENMPGAFLQKSTHELAQQVVRNKNSAVVSKQPVPLVVGFKNVPIVTPVPALSISSQQVKAPQTRNAPVKVSKTELFQRNPQAAAQQVDIRVGSGHSPSKLGANGVFGGVDPARFTTEPNLAKISQNGSKAQQTTHTSLPSARAESRNTRQVAMFNRTSAAGFGVQASRVPGLQASSPAVESYSPKKQIAASNSEKGFGILGSRMIDKPPIHKVQSQAGMWPLSVSAAAGSSSGLELNGSRQPAESGMATDSPKRYATDSKLGKRLVQSNSNTVLGDVSIQSRQEVPSKGYSVMLRTNTAMKQIPTVSRSPTNPEQANAARYLQGSKSESRGLDIFRDLSNAGLDHQRQFVLKASNNTPIRADGTVTQGFSALKQRELKQKQFRASNSKNLRFSTSQGRKDAHVQLGIMPSPAPRRAPEISPLMVSSSRKDEELRNFMDWHVGSSTPQQQGPSGQKKSPLFSYTNTTGTRRNLERNLAGSAAQMARLQQY